MTDIYLTISLSTHNGDDTLQNQNWYLERVFEPYRRAWREKEM